MHPLLLRLLKKFELDAQESPGHVESWRRFVEAVSSAYERADQERDLLERSLALSSTEMQSLYDDLRASTEQALFSEKEKAQVILSSIGEAVIAVDQAGRIAFANAVAERLPGWAADDMIGKPFNERCGFRKTRSNAGPTWHPVRLCMLANEVVPIPTGTVFEIRARGPEALAVKGSAAPMRDRDGTCVGCVLVLQDMGEELSMRALLSHQASHDTLTGLNNRFVMERHLKAVIRDAQRRNATHALLYLDLDQFKVVNDTCGHAAGDELLKQLARALAQQVRSTDVLARLGGDEFGVLLRDCGHEQALRVAQGLIDKVAAFRFAWKDQSFQIGVSIGAVIIDRSAHRLQDALGAADMACYAAKDTGRNRVYVYEHSDSELRRRTGDMHWTSRIMQAMEEGRFMLYSQSIAPVATDTGTADLEEILIRMRDPDGELVMPGVFLPPAQRFNLMTVIDRWVLRTAFSALGKHRRGATTDRIFFINLSGDSLNDPAFAEFVRELFRAHQIPPANIGFEITETAVVGNLNESVGLVGELRRMGCRIALDDFGTGLSSFAYLRSLPIDFLKIDGQFVRNADNSPLDNAIIESIVNVARKMGVHTVAEYVETDSVLNCMRKLGVDYVQGFAVAMPMPFADPADATVTPLFRQRK